MCNRASFAIRKPKWSAAKGARKDSTWAIMDRTVSGTYDSYFTYTPIPYPSVN
jgi:hypothetical protein